MYIPPSKILAKYIGPFMVDSTTILVRDLNGKSYMWGSGGSDERGRLLEDFVESQGATVINTGQPTYQHYNGLQSHLDVAIISSDLAIRANWDVLNNTMGSDHSPTVVTLDEVGEIDHASGDRSFPKLSKTN